MTQAELHYYERVPQLLANIANSLATIAKALSENSANAPKSTDNKE